MIIALRYCVCAYLSAVIFSMCVCVYNECQYVCIRQDVYAN